ncbi:MAG TPA: nitroreductase family protein [Ensifer sp.]|nr:nitroreductase family protein [Ensifer sp.]
MSRQTEFPVDPLFTARWSPRSFVPKAISDKDLKTILEAASYAPSAMNAQPWRFVYAHRDTPEFEKLAAALNEFNAMWAKNASVLVLIFSQKTVASDTGEEKPFYSHAFDAGAAWMSLALQAHMLGYHAHAMGGVLHEKAMELFNVPSSFRLEVGVAIGTRGEKEALPERLQEREAPSPRKPLSAIAGNGTFVA